MAVATSVLCHDFPGVERTYQFMQSVLSCGDEIGAPTTESASACLGQDILGETAEQCLRAGGCGTQMRRVTKLALR